MVMRQRDDSTPLRRVEIGRPSATTLRKYQMSVEEYERRVELQAGVCAICKQVQRMSEKLPDTQKLLVIDHDHETGAVRGLLCDRCNTALGLFGDTLDSLHSAAQWVEEAVQYLQRHELSEYPAWRLSAQERH